MAGKTLLNQSPLSASDTVYCVFFVLPPGNFPHISLRECGGWLSNLQHLKTCDEHSRGYLLHTSHLFTAL